MSPCPICKIEPEMLASGPHNWMLRCPKCKLCTDPQSKEHTLIDWESLCGWNIAAVHEHERKCGRL